MSNTNKTAPNPWLSLDYLSVALALALALLVKFNLLPAIKW